MKILVVDDDPDCCEDLGQFLIRIDYEVMKAYSGKQAIEVIDKSSFDLILSDVNMPEINGLDIVKKINKSKKNHTEIILISGKEDIIKSINAFELGIFDFITKPINFDYLIEQIEKIEKSLLQTQKKDKIQLSWLLNDPNNNKLFDIYKVEFKKYHVFSNKKFIDVGIFSEKMDSIYKKIRKLQNYHDIPILIEGKTGTGKEIIAKFIHFEAPSHNEPFIAINCSTINKEMFEAELFGYERGAFTGANPKGKDGFIEHAGNGTLFLDEITEISSDIQSKLLRVLQEGEYYKLGSTKTYKNKSRIVCATNLNIENHVKNGIFREDLYYRLNICKITIPPLTERKEEIIPLVIFFIRKLNEKFNKNVRFIESKVIKLLYNYNWPGNVRELKNFITQILIFIEGNVLKAEHFNLTFNMMDSFKIINSSDNKHVESVKLTKTHIEDFQIPSEQFDLKEHINSIISTTLQKFEGNKTKTAKYLGITRHQLYNRYKI